MTLKAPHREPTSDWIRPAPTNCQNEPPYPAHCTVVLSISAPEMVCHQASERCPTEYPHKIAVCGEFDRRAALPETKR
jgi:hypothetical protein